ncbi:hypothetical protein [Roseivirga sp.]|uniref:hypothetical protein n=1 Tax=Roseivirga sp. TaxID=1964215 RepID=UPI002B2691A6|nr:hypothetical protein [Roseivirga sp.]
MKKILLGAMLIMCNSNTFAQSEQVKINKDVWYNFMQAYQDLNASLFNHIHTDDVLRIPIDQNKILVGREYKDSNLNMFNLWNEHKIKQRIQFSFTSRIQKGDWAYETGIYKLTRYSGFNPEHLYGKFNVTLKRMNGIWKIYMDADTSEDATVNESDFLKARILQ